LEKTQSLRLWHLLYVTVRVQQLRNFSGPGTALCCCRRSPRTRADARGSAATCNITREIRQLAAGRSRRSAVRRRTQLGHVDSCAFMLETARTFRGRGEWRRLATSVRPRENGRCPFRA